MTVEETLCKGDNNMKSTFLNHEKPLITAMIQCPTADECIAKIKASLAEGAEAFGIQLCQLRREFRSKEGLKEIFDACEGKPIYVTSYRHTQNEGYTDEECCELLLQALDAGATLLDVMGDTFCIDKKYQLTFDQEAVKKQKAFIDEVHRRGGEVLMSTHTPDTISYDECLMIAKAQAERGADVLKIVVYSHSTDELPKYISAIQQIKKETNKTLLFLVTGVGETLRYVGPNFGVDMYLCVQNHGPKDTPAQPLIKRIKAIRDNIIFEV